MDQPPAKLTISNKKLIGAGLGIMVVHAIINIFPKSVERITTTPIGITIIFWIDFILIALSALAIITITSLVFSVFQFGWFNTFEKIKIGPVEITLKKPKEIDTSNNE